MDKKYWVKFKDGRIEVQQDVDILTLCRWAKIDYEKIKNVPESEIYAECWKSLYPFKFKGANGKLIDMGVIDDE